jgi:hypothetical protein
LCHSILKVEILDRYKNILLILYLKAAWPREGKGLSKVAARPCLGISIPLLSYPVLRILTLCIKEK